MKAIPYLRVSTDDKGQDPERQHDLIKTWAAREQVELLPAIKDEGTSADKTDPFERPRFLEAIEEARDKGAEAIVIETPDRLTRRGMGHYFVSVHTLKKDHRLKLWQSDQSLQQQESFVGEILIAIQTAMAQQWMERHKRAVKSGMERARLNGAHFGRKPKQFTETELDLIKAEMAKPVYANKAGTRPNPDRLGWKGLAHEINRRRGVWDIADPAARARKAISEGTIKRVVRQFRLSGKAPPAQIAPPDEMGVST